jgi:hypothetical protein
MPGGRSSGASIGVPTTGVATGVCLVASTRVSQGLTVLRNLWHQLMRILEGVRRSLATWSRIFCASSGSPC